MRRLPSTRQISITHPPRAVAAVLLLGLLLSELVCLPCVAQPSERTTTRSTHGTRDNASPPRSDPSGSDPSANALPTSAVWQRTSLPLELHWHLLRLPERVFQLATTPLIPLVDSIQRYHLVDRFYDLITNDAGTIVLMPTISIQGSDGFGGGLQFSHSDLFGDSERFTISAAFQANLDFIVKASYKQNVALLNGRLLVLRVRGGIDKNIRYFGIGGGLNARR